MTSSHHIALSSINSIKSTIQTDKLVCRWFTYLVLQKAVQNELKSNNESAGIYSVLKSIIFIQRLMNISIITAFATHFYTGNHIYLFGAITVLILCLLLQKTKKEHVAGLSLLLLTRDFEEPEITGKSLYQIGEFYGKKYKIISLVNAITAVDDVSRKSLIYMFLFALFIIPLEFAPFLYFITLSYFIIYLVASSNFVYKYLR